ncbi:MAG: 5-methyltetrahydropteroyltriglutamate--homocysteine methyltransferase [Deltaproteobacteria bacterium]|nr:5-methyltetrahydropteroyltriglutamate--homocysteine methyltransferase [Deltaproteobacteria bacterium]MBM4298437.1 5-methyltetrahydropteroyltriglutamate--homocysteine methyltransferase [Deltaproteobacteria bacterium]
MNLPPIAATTIGSFPRPPWLAQNDRSRAVFRLEGADLKQAQDDATALSIHTQDRIGLDLLSDGEQRRTGFINHILSAFEGVDLEHEAVKTIYRRREQPRPVPRIVGKIKRRVPAVVEDVKFAKAQTDKPIKMDVPGPMTIVDSTLDEFYKDEAAMAMDAAAALNAELRDLQAAGCDVIEIDEPAMTRYHEKVFEYGAEALDRCLEGIAVPTVVHLCYGYPGGNPNRQHEYTYPELLEALMKTKIGGFGVEFCRSAYDPSVLSIAKGRIVMFGCVDPSDTPVPPVAQVAERVRTALKYVEPKNLWLAPDCGLMTITRELANAKAKLLVDVAKEVRRTL